MTVRLIDTLCSIVGDSHVLTDPATMSGYLTDWTGRFTGHAEAVVRPRTTDEVAAVVIACGAAGTPLQLQGGNTGLVGGSIPQGGILLSTKRMNDIDPVDTVGASIGVQAGVTVSAINERARAAGLAFGVDLAARDSATAGGIVSTNAGGVRFIRYGGTRAQVLGVEAVMADGSVLRRWSALAKDNVGYDLPGLLSGAEGTLAVITRVLFRLVSPRLETIVLIAAIESATTGIALLTQASTRGLTVEAAELMTAEGVELVVTQGIRRPVETSAPLFALIELSGAGDLESAVTELLSDAGSGLRDAVLEAGPARALWNVRESHTESISSSSSTPVVKLDVSVPLAELDDALAELNTLADSVEYPCRLVLFGHFGDGNIHVNLLDVPVDYAESLTDSVFHIITTHHGSISAEHGIGRAKTPWVALSRSHADLLAMRTIKSALDPHGLLNPGVLFD